MRNEECGRCASGKTARSLRDTGLYNRAWILQNRRRPVERAVARFRRKTWRMSSADNLRRQPTQTVSTDKPPLPLAGQRGSFLLNAPGAGSAARRNGKTPPQNTMLYNTDVIIQNIRPRWDTPGCGHSQLPHALYNPPRIIQNVGERPGRTSGRQGTAFLTYPTRCIISRRLYKITAGPRHFPPARSAAGQRPAAPPARSTCCRCARGARGPT